MNAATFLFNWLRSAIARRDTGGALAIGPPDGMENEARPPAPDAPHPFSATLAPPGRPAEFDAAACRSLLRRLILIADRFPREYDHMYRALSDMLRSFEREGNLTGFQRIWSQLEADVLSTPQWLDLLFPDQIAADPTFSAQARAAKNRRYVAAKDALPGSESPPPGNGAEPVLVNGLVDQLLEALATHDPAAGPPFRFLSRFYFFRDMLYGYFVDAGLKPIQGAIFHQCYLQRRSWRQSYASDYPYQGMERLGISGVKPTEERLARYDIAECLRASDRVLDIGSNNGFWALALAASVGHVDGLEFNPYLVAIANLAKEYLDIRNASFAPGDFVDFETPEKYDVVCSLANHCTIDGNLSIDFEQYIAKVFSLLKPDGFLFFESHNVFGPGAGGAGDDGDLDAKFDIAERYFTVLKHKMTPAYLPAFDVDKLFIVMRRRHRYHADAVRTLRLAQARQRYDY